MEMETPEVDARDSFGKIIGVQTAILAVLLSVFTIFSIVNIPIRFYLAISQATPGPIIKPNASATINWK